VNKIVPSLKEKINRKMMKTEMKVPHKKGYIPRRGRKNRNLQFATIML
jgi:hypothetical protein